MTFIIKDFVEERIAARSLLLFYHHFLRSPAPSTSSTSVFPFVPLSSHRLQLDSSTARRRRRHGLVPYYLQARPLHKFGCTHRTLSSSQTTSSTLTVPSFPRTRRQATMPRFATCSNPSAIRSGATTRVQSLFRGSRAPIHGSSRSSARSRP